MLELELRQAIADLGSAMLDALPMAAALDPPIRVTAAAESARGANCLAELLGFPRLTAATDPTASQFEEVVARHLDLACYGDALARLPAAERGLPAELARLAGQLATPRDTADIPVAGARLRGYAAGDPAAPCVLLSSACGMPVRLIEPWFRQLAGRFRVVSWESRGMFADVGGFAGATDVEAQVDDARAVLDAFDVRELHVAGLCGGAVVAARLAATDARVGSVSLWHGDYDLGEAAERTEHQQNLLELMTMAAESPRSADGIHAILCQSMLDTVPADLAPLALYPYTTPALFWNYCRLNGAIMRDDLRAVLPRIEQPALVVTSRADGTAHPAGSIEVAARLPRAELTVRDRGDHISLFRGDRESLALLDGFLAGTTSSANCSIVR